MAQSKARTKLTQYEASHAMAKRQYLTSLSVVSDDEQNAIIASDQAEEAAMDLKNGNEKV